MHPPKRSSLAPPCLALRTWLIPIFATLYSQFESLTAAYREAPNPVHNLILQMTMEGDDIPDTRVFVTGLPPNLTSEQLGAHFAMRYQVTDAVVVPGRRIGFVGFRNYTLAKNAVKYFDKSYIRMSKISVEMAKPV